MRERQSKKKRRGGNRKGISGGTGKIGKKKADPGKNIKEEKETSPAGGKLTNRMAAEGENCVRRLSSYFLVSRSQEQSMVPPNISIPSGSALVMSRYCRVVAIVSSPGVALAFHHPAPFRIACDGSISAPELSREPGSPPVTDYYRTMAEIQSIEPKKNLNKSIANDRHGVSCVCFLLWGKLPGPDLELYDGNSRQYSFLPPIRQAKKSQNLPENPRIQCTD